MSDDESIQLLQRVRASDSQAAAELFHRYLHRLIALVRTRLPDKLSRRLDPDDVVQSAYRSFFDAAKEGKYVLERSGDLWRLLAAISLNKLAKQRERHGAARRNVFAEQSAAGGDSTIHAVEPEVLAADPTPDQAAALADEMEWLARAMNESQRRMLDMRLAGHAIEEIAETLNCSERTVRRLFEKVKVQLQQRLARGAGASPECAQ